MTMPRGFRFELSGKSDVARWVNVRDRTVSALYSVSEKSRRRYQGSAVKAAKAARARKIKLDEDKEWAVSKFYKKKLASGRTLYFFTANRREAGSLNLQVAGFLELGGLMYRLSGWVKRGPRGLKSLYRVLGTIQPVARPRGKKRGLNKSKPGIIREQEEKSQGVPLY